MILAGKRIKIVNATLYSEEPLPYNAGDIISISNGQIVVACGVGAIAIKILIPEGKGQMDARSYLNGNKLCVTEAKS